MDMKITNNFENKLLSRKEITFQVIYSGKTPTKDDLKVMLCKTLNLSPSTTVIVNVSQVYGMMQSQGVAHSYANEADMGIEPKHFAKRDAKKAKSESAEDKKIEAPKTEDKKE